VEQDRDDEQRRMDCGQVAGEPSGKENVRDAAPVGTKVDGQLCEWTAKAIRHEDQTLCRDDGARDGCSLIRLPSETRVKQVDDGRLDREQASVWTALITGRTTAVLGVARFTLTASSKTLNANQGWKMRSSRNGRRDGRALKATAYDINVSW
jgi:hypothetical protein